MDTNGGRAGPAPGRELAEAIDAVLLAHPTARFEGNALGNLVATVEGEYVGHIDIRAMGVAPRPLDPEEFIEPRTMLPPLPPEPL